MRRSIPTLVLIALLAAPASAGHDNRIGDWQGGGFGAGLGTRFGDGYRSDARSRDEGKVHVATFVAQSVQAGALGHGSISIAAPGQGLTDGRTRATFEAAMLSALAGRGYDTAVSGTAAQTVELTLSHDVAVPAEIRGSPVHGAAETTISNRGSGFGLALGIDLSKPRKALLSTRLEARIRNHATQQVLWEGRADILTRDGSSKWTEQAIATRLADALLDKFPQPTG